MSVTQAENGKMELHSHVAEDPQAVAEAEAAEAEAVAVAVAVAEAVNHGAQKL